MMKMGTAFSLFRLKVTVIYDLLAGVQQYTSCQQGLDQRKKCWLVNELAKRSWWWGYYLNFRNNDARLVISKRANQDGLLPTT